MAKANSKKSGTIHFSWETVEHIFHPKGAGWYVTLVLIVAVIILAGVLMKDWWLVAIVVLGIIALATSKYNKPQKIPYKISPKGVAIADKLYPYSQIKSFWVIYRPPNKSVYFERAQLFAPHLVIRLGIEDPAKIRNYLIKH